MALQSSLGNKIIKGIWTYWQERDGIFVLRGGSNTCYAGFLSHAEAEAFAADLGPEWRVLRWGVYKFMTDDEAAVDSNIRNIRTMHGMLNIALPV
jgi:hypothetical protein